jgi:adenosylcobinamide kinase/adenosylcobinamide-phosphate guanylyltransferase
MFALITGGSGSGKSEYAENLAVRLAAGKRPLSYIATMIPYGQEGKKRVERHRRLRAGKGFEAIECYTKLKDLALPGGHVALLECLSNLTANEMFEESGAREQTVEAVVQGVQILRERCEHLVVVTNDIFSDGIRYDQVTEQYQRYLGEINIRLAAEADQVTEVVCGIPIPVKENRTLQNKKG